MPGLLTMPMSSSLQDPNGPIQALAEHISEDDLEAFVLERLTHEHAQRVLAHMVDCERCSLGLVRETVLIEMLRETLRQMPRPPAC
jgi:anti-sigma factor RsiW